MPPPSRCPYAGTARVWANLPRQETASSKSRLPSRDAARVGGFKSGVFSLELALVHVETRCSFSMPIGSNWRVTPMIHFRVLAGRWYGMSFPLVCFYACSMQNGRVGELPDCPFSRIRPSWGLTFSVYLHLLRNRMHAQSQRTYEACDSQ